MNFIERILALLGVKATPDGLCRRADVLAKQEDFANAVALYKQVLVIDPFYGKAYEGLGKVYFRTGQREEADREFAIADGLEQQAAGALTPDAAVKMGRAFANKNMLKAALALTEPVLQKNPRHLGLMKMIGQCHAEAGNDKKAREMMQSGLEIWPRDPDFHLSLGRLETKAGRTKEGERLTAIGQLLSKIAADAFDADSRAQLGRKYLELEKFSDAAEFFRQAVSLQKNNIENWLGLGECYIKASQFPASVDVLQKAVRLDPADPRGHRLLSSAYQFQGRFDESRSEKEIAAIVDGGQGKAGDPKQMAKFIKYLMSLGRFEDAGRHLEEHLKQWPDSIEMKFLQARLWVKSKRHEEALEILKEVAAAKENWAEPHILMAMSYQRLGDKMSALAEGQLATRLAPRSHAAHKILGDILREQGKFAMAENAYETAEHLRASKKDE